MISFVFLLMFSAISLNIIIIITLIIITFYSCYLARRYSYSFVYCTMYTFGNIDLNVLKILMLYP